MIWLALSKDFLQTWSQFPFQRHMFFLSFTGLLLRSFVFFTGVTSVFHLAYTCFYVNVYPSLYIFSVSSINIFFPEIPFSSLALTSAINDLVASSFQNTDTETQTHIPATLDYAIRMMINWQTVEIDVRAKDDCKKSVKEETKSATSCSAMTQDTSTLMN